MLWIVGQTYMESVTTIDVSPPEEELAAAERVRCQRHGSLSQQGRQIATCCKSIGAFPTSNPISSIVMGLIGGTDQSYITYNFSSD